MIYLGQSNAVRQVDRVTVGKGGAIHPVYDGYCGIDGVARQFMGGYVSTDWIQGIEIVPSHYVISHYEQAGDAIGSTIAQGNIDRADDLQNSTLAEYGSIYISPTADPHWVLRVRSTKPNTFITLYAQINVLLNDGLVAESPRPTRPFKDLKLAGNFTLYFSEDMSGGCLLVVFNQSETFGVVTPNLPHAVDFTPDPTGTWGNTYDIRVGAGYLKEAISTQLCPVYLEIDGKHITPVVRYRYD